MQDALKEAELVPNWSEKPRSWPTFRVAFASSQTSKSSKPLDPAPFAVGFSYGWNDAQDSSIPARNTKVQERTAEFAETNGHEHEGEFNTG